MGQELISRAQLPASCSPDFSEIRDDSARARGPQLGRDQRWLLEVELTRLARSAHLSPGRKFKMRTSPMRARMHD